MDESAELHLLYVLLDSNLPTGGFVSSSGLESYAKHGFLTTSPAYPPHASSKVSATKGIVDFARDEVDNYASTTICFVADAWRAVDSALASGPRAEEEKGEGEKAVGMIEAVDQFHDASLLSHVARRSSRAQGVAMLTLYSRGLSRPPGFLSELDPREERAKDIVDSFRRLVRLNTAPGHLATCWGVITAALGITLERAIHLHLFLHARSLLSSAVRLNVVGPYASSQLLLHPMKDLVNKTSSKYLLASTGLLDQQAGTTEHQIQDPWAWADDERGPATTWPKGELLASRHDLQHSRIFNS